MKQPNPCAPRKRFVTREAAEAARVSVMQRTKVLKFVEACSKCGGYHLSCQK
jgi:hypothetical protein